MGIWRIEGAGPLEGTAEIHGAKNAVLPIMAASLLAERTTLRRCPALTDVEAAKEILRSLGCRLRQEEDTLYIDASGACGCEALPAQPAREMRSSILFLGAMLARFGRARISYPGGCELGPRPIDLHLAGLRRLGAEIREQGGFLDCAAEKRLHGASIALPFPSVGATENLLIAAATAEGETVISNAAREPEVAALAEYLNACGARIACGGDRIRVCGVERLGTAEIEIISDRIEAVTYLCAAAATGGRIRLRHACPAHLAAVLPILEEMGCRLKTEQNAIELDAPQRLSAPAAVKTMPYPGFPTDAQAPLMAALCCARGSTLFTETIFSARYRHVSELTRMGAQIRTEGRMALVQGVERLSGAPVRCTDLRGGAALVIAALTAEGETVLSETRHLDRGYCEFAGQLRALGARIQSETGGADPWQGDRIRESFGGAGGPCGAIRSITSSPSS